MNAIELTAKAIRPLLEFSVVRRLRRNHGLEHATIHVLKRYHLSGQASAGGFMIYGDVPTERLEAAAREALQRMKNGQSQLAVHPNCGTNLVVTGLLTTSIAALGFTNTDRKAAWNRFPVVLLFMVIAALYSQPLGMSVQKHITTSGEPGDLEIDSIKRSEMMLPYRTEPLTSHFVKTRNG